MKTVPAILVGLLLLAVMANRIWAAELSGSFGVEISHFFNSPLYPEQAYNSASLYLQPEFYHQWEKGPALTMVPFARIDSADDERTHFDVRELNFLWVGNRWEALIGIGKVFWGVTEFVHLVDIINQTDVIENIDGESKLGQPMAKLSWLSGLGNFHLFVMPGFRERTFPGPKGRLRTALPVSTRQTTFESGDEAHHVDLALRYSHYIGNLDLGLYHFSGTGREPELRPGVDSVGNPVLFPFYRQIEQTGLDIQMVYGQWLFKAETIRLCSKNEDYIAAVGGFEYTFVGLGNSPVDLGLVAEYAYDERGQNAGDAYANDIIGGLRLALNNPAGSEILIGMSHDLDNGTHNLRLEAGHRLDDRWKLELESVHFLDTHQDDILYDLRDDDYVRLSINYHY